MLVNSSASYADLEHQRDSKQESQSTYKRNIWGAFVQQHWKSYKCCVFGVCVFVALDTQHAMRFRHVAIRGLPLSTIVSHFIT